MDRNRPICTRFLGLAAILVSAAAVGTPHAAPDRSVPTGDAPSAVPIVWRHEHVTFSYVGFTVRYSCDGLEAQVRRILIYLGARKDAKVNASGCPMASSVPGRNAWINADFEVPVPVAPAQAGVAAAGEPVAGAAAPGAAAQWRDVKLTPRQPDFLSDDDCELIEGMKNVFTQTLPLRGLEYRANCFPGSLSDDGFEVSAQALKITDPKGAGPR